MFLIIAQKMKKPIYDLKSQGKFKVNSRYPQGWHVMIHVNRKGGTTSMSDYIIETCSLTKMYGEQASVSDLSIHVKKGRIYGLLGRNGA